MSDYRGTRPDPLKELIGYRPIWGFPARNFQEALVHGLLTAPNAPDLFFLVESDDYVRIDKARHYAAISRGTDYAGCVRDSIDPGCPDWRSEFLLPVEALKSAKLMAFTTSGADVMGGSVHVPFCVRQPGRKYLTCGLPDEPFYEHQRLVSPMTTILDHMSVSLETYIPEGGDIDEKDTDERARLGFLFFILPLLYEYLERDGKDLTFGTMFLLQHTAAHLLGCYNDMGRWSYGDCCPEGYEAIFRDAMDHVVTDAGIIGHMLEHGFRLPGRNDACPCGSGKKFKKCHGRLLA